MSQSTYLNKPERARKNCVSCLECNFAELTTEGHHRSGKLAHFQNGRGNNDLLCVPFGLKCSILLQ